MKNYIITLLFIFVSNITLASEFEIQNIKGKVELLRGKIVATITKETELKDGDIIKTNKASFLKFKVNDSVITIAPYSYYTLSNKKDKKGDHDVGKLLFGNIQAHFLKSMKGNRKISSTTAALGIRGTKILLHVARSASEYTTLYNGGDIKQPNLKELRKLISSNQLFTQVCCVYGDVNAQTKSGKTQKMQKGDIINFFSTGSKLQSFKDQSAAINSSIQKLKLDFK